MMSPSLDESLQRSSWAVAADRRPPGSQSQGAATTDGALRRREAGGRRVLLVDDEPVMRLVVEKILENAGHTLRQANDGLEAVEVFRRHLETIDIVVMDIVMPKMDGRETFTLLRRMRPEIPVLMISGQPQELALEGLRHEPLVRYVGKPFTPPQLLAGLETLLAAAEEP